MNGNQFLTTNVKCLNENIRPDSNSLQIQIELENNYIDLRGFYNSIEKVNEEIVNSKLSYYNIPTEDMAANCKNDIECIECENNLKEIKIKRFPTMDFKKSINFSANLRLRLNESLLKFNKSKAS